jgi:deoxyadenosine/deoxycytidine kinase
MKEFHIDEPREIGRKKQRLSRRDILNIKDELTEVVVRKKIREFIKKEFMEKVIVINSTLGCGKSSVSEALSEKIVGSVIVEGDDYNRLVENFSVYDESKILESIKLIVSRVNDLIEAGNSTVIVDYVFEQPHHLNFLKFHLENSINVYPFYLSANREVIKSRIVDRKRKSLFEALRRNWELKRFKEILDIQEEYIDSGNLGKVINANKKIDVVVSEIVRRI